MLFMENVEEIQEWGPLDKNGHPIPKKKGREYRRFINAMKKLGFKFDSRVLVAADFGAPTTRKRWYAVFRSDGKPIRWPEPTHCKDGKTNLLGTLKPWVPVSTCLDFTDLGSSIFERPKPLADATLKRIANGIRKFVAENQNPYYLPDEQALPFLIQYHSETSGSDVRGQTVCARFRLHHEVLQDRHGTGSHGTAAYDHHKPGTLRPCERLPDQVLRSGTERSQCG